MVKDEHFHRCEIRCFVWLAIEQMHKETKETFTTTLLHRENELLLHPMSEAKKCQKGQTEMSKEHII